MLLSKNANVPIPPPSLAKLMTAEVVFEALEKGLTTLDTAYPVSENAWRTGGAPSGTSTMFARIKSSPTVADLLQGMIVQAANDGAIVLAEGLAGSERAFAERMNDRARELGLAASRISSTPQGYLLKGRRFLSRTWSDWRSISGPLIRNTINIMLNQLSPGTTSCNATAIHCCGLMWELTAWVQDLRRHPALHSLGLLSRMAAGSIWR